MILIYFYYYYFYGLLGLVVGLCLSRVVESVFFFRKFIISIIEVKEIIIIYLFSKFVCSVDIVLGFVVSLKLVLRRMFKIWF